ncbi:MAG: class A beta-lactamase, partial [Brevundimonas sp.]|nr:class A beta-lactamase [Brevundimonas sp.]
MAGAGALGLAACTPRSQTKVKAEAAPDLFLNDLETR